MIYCIRGFMAAFDIKGKDIHLDEEGYLQDMEEWNRDASEYLARKAGMKVLEKTGASPITKQVCRAEFLQEG
jgi:sulfur relay (sulfurtransferase) DsrC/TusE family protein